MKLHEYQSKKLFDQIGIPIHKSKIIQKAENVRHIFNQFSGAALVKARVLSGGRGKAGGIRLVRSENETENITAFLLKSKIHECAINKVIIEELIDFDEGYSVGIGAEPIVGLEFSDLLPFFEEDPSTEKVILLGEFGGEFEEAAASYISRHFTKSVLALIVGKSAPAKIILGHAGAVITNDCGSAQRKIDVLCDAGVLIAEIIEDIPALLEKN